MHERRSIKILQFGEGVFLRAFADWMIDILNEKTSFDGGIVMVRPRGGVFPPEYAAQHNEYTVALRGLRDEVPLETYRTITAVEQCLALCAHYDDFLRLAENPALRFIISNTTESGIVYDEQNRAPDTPPSTFPAKLAAFLYHRWKYFGEAAERYGIVIIPCELIENNGAVLRDCVLRYAALWRFEAAFTAWLDTACDFCNSLVDRIVAGFPSEESADIYHKIGREDQLLVAAEPYHLWVIEPHHAPDYENELPFRAAGLNVVWTDDARPYRERKVRILNGAHTMLAAAGLLAGFKTVRECSEDATIAAYIRGGIYDEIIPSMARDIDEARLLRNYADEILARFANPFIRHELSAIIQNSVVKFKTRLLPSMMDYYTVFKTEPHALSSALDMLILYYEKNLQKTEASELQETRKAMPWRTVPSTTVPWRMAP